MLTQADIDEIDRELRAGVSPEDIARKRQTTYRAMRLALLNSGKKWKTTRYLVDARPAEVGQEGPLEMAL
ncbi:MAG: hypothetical protein ABIY70_24750 [Capsulimonas sp.]|uniref:hypothetical protein n=1 Tax=Capsulimonas sp. TaxID=2494211 RepID=UPI0032662513